MSSATLTACAELLSMRPGVFSATGPNGDLYLATWRHAESLGQLSAGVHTVLRCLADPEREHTHAELVAIAEEQDGDLDAGGVARLLDRGRAATALSPAVTVRGRSFPPLAASPPPPPPLQEVGAASPPVLPRFARLRRADGGLQLETPRAWSSIRVHVAAVVSILGGLADPRA